MGTSNLKLGDSEPIAVIGFGLKLPQGISTQGVFWDFLVRGASARTEVPAHRYHAEAFLKSEYAEQTRHQPGSINTEYGHFISEPLDRFDAPFFSITPHEAECMDPQQRWLLETSYHALENAGIPLNRVQGSKTSVYVGFFMNDHETVVKKDLDVPNTYHATGDASAMLANRISWFYDLNGPSVTVNTACSGSLVALHLACQSIRTGETTMGLVCGSNLMFAPESTSGLSNLNFLSPDGRCYAFDERANGYARGEGITCVVIKSLTAALEDGDTIRAIICGTGVNSDGRTPGVTQPSSEAQASLIRETYSRFGLDLSSTRYFEAHGTGTKLGDPLEARAIADVFKPLQRQGERLYIGALKSNIGHLEGASGLASVIKAILVLENAFIPPNILLDRVNPIIKDDWGLAFPATGQKYPGDGIRRASVNSFGFGGTNAHAVLDDAKSFMNKRQLKGNLSSQVAKNVVQKASSNQTSKLLVWSAADEDGLRRLRTAYSTHLSTQIINEEYFNDLAYTLSQHRTHFPWRSFSVCKTSSNASDMAFSTPIRTYQTLRLCFLFTGQDTMGAAMGRELVSYAVYRRSIEHSDAILRDIGCQFSILEKIWCDEETCPSDLDRPEFGQPICTALQIALVELLTHWCIKPYAVVGHSSGEIAAAYCAGVTTKTQALKLAYWRGTAVAAATHVKAQRDGILTLHHSLEEGKKTLTSLNDSKEMRQRSPQIARCDSLGHLNVSGERAEKDILVSAQETDDSMAEALNGSTTCYNSQYIQEVVSVYKALTQNLFSSDHSSTKPPTLDCIFASSVYGKVFESGSDAAEISKVDYWIGNLVCPARSTEAMASIRASCNTTGGGTDVHFLGMGPHSTTRSMAKDVLPNDWDVENAYFSVWSQQQSAVITAMTLAGKLHCLGYPVDLEAVNQLALDKKGKCRSLDDLPSYPFDHSRDYWLESRISKCYRLRRFPHNEFVGTTAPDWNSLEPHWNNRLVLREGSYLQDHKVAGAVVYPAAGMLVMAIEATRQLEDIDKPPRGYRFQNVKFSKLLAIPKSSQGIETQLHLCKDEDDSNDTVTIYEFRLYVNENEEWSRCCHGSIALEHHDIDLSSRKNAITDHEHIVDSCHLPISRDEFYRSLCTSGLEYGPAFQSINSLCVGHGQNGCGEVDIQRRSSLKMRNRDPAYLIHPAALDCIFQVAFSGLNRGGEIEIPTYVPTEIKSLWLSAGISRGIPNESLARVSAEVIPQDPRAYNASYVSLWKNNKQPLVIGDLTLTSIGSAKKLVQVRRGPVSLYHVVWKPDVDLLASESQSLPFVADQTKTRPEDVENVLLTEIACHLAMSGVLKAVKEEENLTEELKYLQKYLNWMRHQVTLLENSKPHRHLLLRENGIFNTKDQIFEKVEKLGPEGKLIVKLAKTLIPIVQGRVNALQVLFEDETLTEYYGHQNPPPEVYTSVQKYIDCMAHANPHLRVLEIGAGTGRMTNRVLQALSVSEFRADGHEEKRLRFSEYVFTDVSPAFFQKANENFGRDGFVCRVLDIEKEPEEQGFAVELYDMVIASNVLHATRNLSSTLRNTRSLLKPSGKLLLIEGISPDSLRTSFIFGCLPGWWLSTEPFRKWSPLVSEKRWDQLLRDNGFTGTELVVGGASCLSSMMVSTASVSSTVENKGILIESHLSIIRESKSVFQSALALSIQNVGSQSGMQISITDPENTQKSAGKMCIFLQTIDHFSFKNPKEKELTCLKIAFRSLRRVLWVTWRSHTRTDFLEQDAVQGLSHSILSENKDLKLVTLGLENFKEISKATQDVWKVLRHYFFNTSYSAQSQISSEEIIQKDGALCIRRVLPAKNLENEIREIKPEHPAHGSNRELSTSDDEVEIEIKVSSIRPQDLANFSRKPIQLLQTRACAGVVTRAEGEAQKQFQIGARVVAITQVSYNIFEGRIRCPTCHVRTIPEETTFERSAVLLFEFIAAHEALSEWAQLQKGQSVIIEDGSNALGQATLQLALAAGAEVFIIASYDEDIKKLSDTYRIPASHIFKSRDKRIKGEVIRLTAGRGVNVLIIFGTGNDLRVSLDCVAPRGKVVEMSLSESKTPSSGLTAASRLLKKNISYVNVDFSQVFQDRRRISELLAIVMGMIESKILVKYTQPLPKLEASEIVQASQSREFKMPSGNILVSLSKINPHSIKTASKPLTFPSNATYVVAGGLGGLGRSIVEWMVSCGARNLLLLSRKGAEGSSATLFLEKMVATGTTMVAPKCDVGDENTVQEVLEKAAKHMPPIRGCIQASMVLRSGMFENLSLDQWTQTLRSKVGGSLNLHKYLPSTLDFYIMLSSVCGIIGAGGQSNYAFGCAYQDALARHSAAVGQKAVSIDLGIVDGIGYMTNHPLEGSFMRSIGMQPISEQYLHAMLGYYCNPDRIVTQGGDESQVVAGIMTEDEMHRKGIVSPRFFSRPLWRHLSSPPKRNSFLKPPVAVVEQQQQQPDPSSTGRKSPRPSKDNTSTQPYSGSPHPETQAQTPSFITHQICLRLSDMLSLPSTEIDASQPLRAFGVDSLVAMELQNWLREKLGRGVGVSDILGGRSIGALAEKIAMQE